MYGVQLYILENYITLVGKIQNFELKKTNEHI